jgi:hypothetical protein
VFILGKGPHRPELLPCPALCERLPAVLPWCHVSLFSWGSNVHFVITYYSLKRAAFPGHSSCRRAPPLHYCNDTRRPAGIMTCRTSNVSNVRTLASKYSLLLDGSDVHARRPGAVAEGSVRPCFRFRRVPTHSLLAGCLGFLQANTWTSTASKSFPHSPVPLLHVASAGILLPL